MDHLILSDHDVTWLAICDDNSLNQASQTKYFNIASVLTAIDRNDFLSYSHEIRHCICFSTVLSDHEILSCRLAFESIVFYACMKNCPSVMLPHSHWVLKL